MSADKKVAGYYVTLGVAGVAKAKASVKALVSGIIQSVDTVKGKVGEMWRAFSSPAATLLGGAGAAGFFKGFIQPAAQGTLEGLRLGQAFEYLQRVIGDGLAPYVRTLTSLIIKAADAFRQLSPEIKDMVVRIGLAGMALGTFMVMLPLIKAAIGMVAAAIGFLVSPIGAVVIGMVGLLAYSYLTWKGMKDGAGEASDSIQESNETWIGHLIRSMKGVVKAVVEAFNWMMRQVAKIQDALARLMSNIGEAIGLLPEGTTDALNRMKPIEPFKFDVEKVMRGMDQAAEYADKKGNEMLDLFESIKELFNFTKEGEQQPGFNRIYKVQIEDGRQSYDRLLTAFAGGQGESLAAQDLAVNKKGNEKLDTVIDKLGQLIGVVSSKKTPIVGT